MDNLLNDMGQRLSKRRKQLGLTQEQLAEKAKTTTQTISTAETGRKALRPENILKLCDALDISIDYLFRGEFNNEDFSILSTKISQLTTEQYQYLETIIDTFIAAVASNKKEGIAGTVCYASRLCSAKRCQRVGDCRKPSIAQ